MTLAKIVYTNGVNYIGQYSTSLLDFGIGESINPPLPSTPLKGSV